MDLSVAWVRKPQDASGLDHLGTQAPCTQIYSQLLPGITNVTNRARYYSIYPWIVWSLDRRGLADAPDAFVANFRRSECLLTLLAERHARVTGQASDRHGAALVGRDALLPALNALEAGQELRLSTYAVLEQSDNRYFQNRLGGLGQYYLGPFQDLGLLDGSRKPWVLCSKEKGEPLAKAVDARVDADLFFKTVREDRVSLKRLDALDTFCFCKLRDPCREHDLLLDLFLDRKQQDEFGGTARKRSLCLILHWIQTVGQLAEELGPVSGFRRSIYALNDALENPLWSPPEPLRKMANGWRTYERNDFVSIAAQALFFAAIRRLESQGVRPQNALAFKEWFLADASTSIAVKRLGSLRWSDASASFVKAAPSRDRWDLDFHEIELRERIFAEFRAAAIADAPDAVYVPAAQLLMLAAARDDKSAEPYIDCPLPPNYDTDYPITLRSLRRAAEEQWSDMSVADVLGWIVTEWGLKTHLLIALRKLRQSSQSTFRILPTDRGLEVQPGQAFPAPTNPRLSQAFHVLADLGLTQGDAQGRLALTAEGTRVLEYGLAH